METLSRHFLKRRALAREKVEQEKLLHAELGSPGAPFTSGEVRRLIFVEKAQRGPFRWRVVRR